MIAIMIYCRWYSIRWSKNMEKKSFSNCGDTAYIGDPNIPCAPRFSFIRNDFDIDSSSVQE